MEWSWIGLGVVADRSELDWAWWQKSQSDAPGACSQLSNYFKPRLRLAKNVQMAQSVRFTFSPALIREAFASIKYLSRSARQECIDAHRFSCSVTIAPLNHIYVPTSYFTKTTRIKFHKNLFGDITRERTNIHTNKQTKTNMVRMLRECLQLCLSKVSKISKFFLTPTARSSCYIPSLYRAICKYQFWDSVRLFLQLYEHFADCFLSSYCADC
jgi:hypothetical protein